MGEIIDSRLPANLSKYFSQNTMTAVVSTVDADGFPRGAPMSLFYAPSEEYLTMALQNHSQTYKNLERDGRAALTFTGKEDTAFSIRGVARVIKSRMNCSDLVGVVAIKIQEVKNNTAPDVKVSRGIKTEFRSPAWQDLVERILSELRQITVNDIEG